MEFIINNLKVTTGNPIVDVPATLAVQAVATYAAVKVVDKAVAYGQRKAGGYFSGLVQKAQAATAAK